MFELLFRLKNSVFIEPTGLFIPTNYRNHVSEIYNVIRVYFIKLHYYY